MKKNELISLSTDYKKMMESNTCLVTSIRERNLYENGEKTDKADGFSVKVIFIDGELVGEEFSIKASSIENIEQGSKVHLKIDESKVYGKTQKGSSFASVELSLLGSVTLVDEKGGK